MKKDFVILVAEDDPSDAELLRLAIRRAGMVNPVLFVNDGEQAIEYLQGNGEFADREKYPFPKIVITDLKMPRRTGLELLEWLRKHPECKVIPTVLMSGSNLTGDIGKAYSIGANSYFRKPSSLNELTELIKLLNVYWTTAEVPAIQQQNCDQINE